MAVAPDGNIRIKTFETTALASPDAIKDYDAPVGFPLNATIDVPNATPHIVKVFDSPGGSDDGTLLADFLYDPSYKNVEIRPDKYYIVGSGSPAPDDGDTELTDTDLAGYDYDVEIRGMGTMMSDGSEIDINDDGGFSLTQDENRFYEGQVIIVHFLPKITKASTGGGGGTFIKGIITVESDVTLNSDHFNYIIDIAATGTAITVTLPPLNTVPANTLIALISNRGNQKNATIKTQASDNILWNVPRTVMYLGQDEQLWLMNGGLGWYVVNAMGNFDKVGLQLWGDRVMPGTIKRNGALLSRSIYPRLFNEFVLKLPPNQITIEAAWDSNRGFCTLGDGSTNFRIMDSRGLFTRALDDGRGIDTGRSTPGSYQADDVGPHTHQIKFNEVGGIQNNQNGGGLGDTKRPGGPTNPNAIYTSEENTGKETRGKNEAKIPLIFI